MGKKEASKGREWEKGRRDVLNQTFSELHRALPNYVDGQLASKKTILLQAVACIHKLQHAKKGGNIEGDESTNSDTLQKWVKHVLGKFYQLLSFLDSINVRVPSEFLSFEAPPNCIVTIIADLLSKIGKYSVEDRTHAQASSAVIAKKHKLVKKSRGSLPDESISLSDNVMPGICPKNNILLMGGKASQCQTLKSDFNSSVVSNAPVIQSNPLVVQSSPLQMPPQLLFASNTPSSPLSSSLPLLVSVTGVKTVNPFIFVQSNILAPNLPAVPKTICSNGRPIQPGPRNKSTKKLKKVAIPALKQKTGNIVSLRTVQKLFRRGQGKSIIKVAENCNSLARSKTISKTVLIPKPMSSDSDATSNQIKSAKVIKSSSHVAIEKQPLPLNADSCNLKAATDVDKENIAEINSAREVKSDGNDGNNFLSGTSKGKTAPKDFANKTVISQELNEHSHSNQTHDICNKQQNCHMANTKSLEPRSNNLHKKQRSDIRTNNIREIKSDSERGYEGEERSPDDSGEESSPAKLSKTNYSISALCARQQLLQNIESTTLAPEVVSEDSPVVERLKATVIEDATSALVSDAASTIKSNENSCSQDRGKETIPSSAADSFSEWSDKCKSKTDRVCSSYNMFPGLPLHNSKNTFIPIGDIENFKSVPESFDSTFGLPLPSSDFSNDILASLQVPSGGQHPESISPTAAFLLAFPLVSTSKATELLSDDGVCENNDSQPGIKTILQIGNLDCDTPVTKCVSVFSSMENSVVYSSASSSAFSQEPESSSSVKCKTIESTAGVGNFLHKDRERVIPVKTSNNAMALPGKESLNFNHRLYASSHKDNQPFLSKPCYQPSYLGGIKGNGELRNECSPPNRTNAQNSIPSVQSKTDLEENILSKNAVKANIVQDSIPFLACDKQVEWVELSQTSQMMYSEFSSTTAPRTDCIVNYAPPPVLMSSSSVSEELILVSTKSQATSSSSGVMSWSTIDNTSSSKPASKSSQFQELFPVSKASAKHVEPQQLAFSHSVTNFTPTETLLTSSSCIDAHKLSGVPHHYNQTHQNLSQDILMNKQTVSSNDFSASISDANGKKSFSPSSGPKLLQCGSSELMKVSSDNSTSGTVASQQPNLIPTNTTTSSASIIYSPSESKRSKINNLFYEERSSVENTKPGMNASSDNQSSKQIVHQINCGENTIVSEGKQQSIASTYNHAPTLNIKETVHNHTMMNAYQSEVNGGPKEQLILTNQCPVGISDIPESKKAISHCNHNNNGTLVEVSKQNVPGHNFNAENHALSNLNFTGSSVGSTEVSEDQYNDKVNSLEGQQVKQTSLQRQQCGRSDINKESVTHLHRPPVNWMTAPDIRSHQHHSGPSFGNSSNVNSTQGLLYLQEHSKDVESNSSALDQSSNFHCLDLPHSGQSLYKGNELHLFGNESIDNFHDTTAWSPCKNGSSSMLGNIMIPSTLPTLVGDLALGDNNISRPFLSSFSNDIPSCPKKSARRAINTSRRTEKIVEENSIGPVIGPECVGSFLSVSQLVDSGSGSKSRSGSKEMSTPFVGSFQDQDAGFCQTSKQNTTKPASSNYSTEALLSNPQQVNQFNYRKRRSHSGHYTNSYVGGGMSYQNVSSVSLQVQSSQAQFLPDLPRANEYEGTFLHSDTVPPFMLSNSSRSHRNHSYSLQNISSRSSGEEIPSSQRPQQTSVVGDVSAGRHRTTNNSINNSSNSSPSTLSSNIIDFGYINVPPAVLQDDLNFTNPPPPPHASFFGHHHSYPMPTPQDALYSSSRLPIHPSHGPQNGNVQSPSATTLTNFHLSTIFPEINEKIIC